MNNKEILTILSDRKNTYLTLKLDEVITDKVEEHIILRRKKLFNDFSQLISLNGALAPFGLMGIKFTKNLIGVIIQDKNIWDYYSLNLKSVYLLHNSSDNPYYLNNEKYSIKDGGYIIDNRILIKENIYYPNLDVPYNAYFQTIMNDKVKPQIINSEIKENFYNMKLTGLFRKNKQKNFLYNTNEDQKYILPGGNLIVQKEVANNLMHFDTYNFNYLLEKTTEDGIEKTYYIYIPLDNDEAKNLLNLSSNSNKTQDLTYGNDKTKYEAWGTIQIGLYGSKLNNSTNTYANEIGTSVSIPTGNQQSYWIESFCYSLYFTEGIISNSTNFTPLNVFYPIGVRCPNNSLEVWTYTLIEYIIYNLQQQIKQEQNNLTTFLIKHNIADSITVVDSFDENINNENKQFLILDKIKNETVPLVYTGSHKANQNPSISSSAFNGTNFFDTNPNNRQGAEIALQNVKNDIYIPITNPDNTLSFTEKEYIVSKKNKSLEDYNIQQSLSLFQINIKNPTGSTNKISLTFTIPKDLFKTIDTAGCWVNKAINSVTDKHHAYQYNGEAHSNYWLSKIGFGLKKSEEEDSYFTELKEEVNLGLYTDDFEDISPYYPPGMKHRGTIQSLKALPLEISIKNNSTIKQINFENPIDLIITRGELSKKFINDNNIGNYAPNKAYIDNNYAPDACQTAEIEEVIYKQPENLQNKNLELEGIIIKQQILVETKENENVGFNFQFSASEGIGEDWVLWLKTTQDAQNRLCALVTSAHPFFTREMTEEEYENKKVYYLITIEKINDTYKGLTYTSFSDIMGEIKTINLPTTPVFSLSNSTFDILAPVNLPNGYVFDNLFYYTNSKKLTLSTIFSDGYNKYQIIYVDSNITLVLVLEKGEDSDG